MATAFGLQPLFARAGNLYVIVRSNDGVLVATVQLVSHPLADRACHRRRRAAFSSRGVLTRQALRPLDDVTAALQRFASGDLTPHTIAADEGHELGAAGSRV